METTGIIAITAVIVIGIVGGAYNLVNIYLKRKERFNWIASVVPFFYYAYYGRWGLGLLFGFLFAVLSGVPFIASTPVIAYAGIRAKADLPNKEQKKGILYVCLMAVWIAFLFYAKFRN